MIKYNHVDEILARKVGYRDSSPYVKEDRPAVSKSLINLHDYSTETPQNPYTKNSYEY